MIGVFLIADLDCISALLGDVNILEYFLTGSLFHI